MVEFFPKLFLSFLISCKIDRVSQMYARGIYLSKHIKPWLFRRAESFRGHSVEGVLSAIWQFISILYCLCSFSTDVVLGTLPVSNARVWNAWSFDRSTRSNLISNWWSVTLSLHAFWKIVLKTDVVRHVLVFGIAKVFGQVEYVWLLGLLHEQYQFGVIWSFLNPLKV